MLSAACLLRLLNLLHATRRTDSRVLLSVMNATMQDDYWIEDSIKDKPFGDTYELGKELGK